MDRIRALLLRAPSLGGILRASQAHWKRIFLQMLLANIFLHAICECQLSRNAKLSLRRCSASGYRQLEVAHHRVSATLESRITTTLTMRPFLALTGLLGFCASAVQATALTYKLEAHEKACFFATTESQGTKVAFYFAVWGSCFAHCLSL